MTAPRRTFIVRVDGGEVVVEDVRGRRQARVAEVAGVGAQIAAWLADTAAPEHEPVAAGHGTGSAASP